MASPVTWLRRAARGLDPRYFGWRPTLGVVLAVALIAALILAWQASPLAELGERAELGRLLAELRAHPATPAVTLAAVVVAVLAFVPLTPLVAALGFVFPLAPALGYGLGGAMLGALLGYALGRLFGALGLAEALERRFATAKAVLDRHGAATVAVVRLTPIAHNSAVNLLGGLLRLPVGGYLAGSLAGFLPHIVAFTIIGAELESLVATPAPRDLAIAAAALLGWLGAILALARLRQKRRSA